MDMNFDPAAFGMGTRPDWRELRERLHARRKSGRPVGPSRDRGSFDPRSARLVANWVDGLDVVNPVASTDGKSVDRNEAAIAGTTPAGDRG